MRWPQNKRRRRRTASSFQALRLRQDGHSRWRLGHSIPRSIYLVGIEVTLTPSCATSDRRGLSNRYSCSTLFTYSLLLLLLLLYRLAAPATHTLNTPESCYIIGTTSNTQVPSPCGSGTQHDRGPSSDLPHPHANQPTHTHTTQSGVTVKSTDVWPTNLPTPSAPHQRRPSEPYVRGTPTYLAGFARC